jgi:hypothetical protein
MADIQKITDALKMLDHANAEHWTDDGLPRTSVVQKLANDPTIKRGDIQNAAPGFARTVLTDADGVALSTETGAAPGSGGGGAPEVMALAPVEPIIEDDGQMTEDEVKEILAQRVKEAEQTFKTATANMAEAQRVAREAQKAVGVAREAQQSANPPLSAAENIKRHLASQQERLLAQHGVAPPARIDQAMAHGNSRGWSRPQRQFVQPDGTVVTAGPRTQFSRKTPDLINRRVARV